MRKELTPVHEMVACDVCGRTILKGERTEPYIVPDGSRRLVCELCTLRAENAGWLREAAHSDLPEATPRTEPRRSIRGRLRRLWSHEAPPAPAQEAHEGHLAWEEEHGAWEDEPADVADEPRPYKPHHQSAERHAAVEVDAGAGDRPDEVPHDHRYEDGADYEETVPYGESEAYEREAAADQEASLDEPAVAPDASYDEPVDDTDSGAIVGETRSERRERRARRRLRDPRHVRAVPVGAEVKVERALEIFNASSHRRTVAGLVRTLGEPWAMAVAPEDSTSEVTVVVAWELSWYQYRVDLGDADEPVALMQKGAELQELDQELRRWNATASADGALRPGAPLKPGGSAA